MFLSEARRDVIPALRSAPLRSCGKAANPVERRAEGAAIENAATRTLRQHEVARAITAIAFNDLCWTIFVGGEKLCLCIYLLMRLLCMSAQTPIRTGPKFFKTHKAAIPCKHDEFRVPTAARFSTTLELRRAPSRSPLMALTSMALTADHLYVR